MLRLFGISILGIVLIGFCSIQAFPDLRNPNSEYELINPRDQQVNNKPVFVPITTTPRSVLVVTPPLVPEGSKNFVYDPVSKTWSLLKKNDPLPSEDALIWNQKNDKFLTMPARI